jgi:DUF438 domain-containing protein
MIIKTNLEAEMETINKEAKKQAMKDIILGLHWGLSAEAARDRFEREIGNVSSTEIAEIEQSLIDEGLSPDEIKKFCNVHALIFESALAKAGREETSPYHPVYLFKLENREIEKLVDSLKNAAAGAVPGLLARLKEIEKHYERKEQLLFPYLEKHGFMGPSKVMWGKDNEIRDMLRAAVTAPSGEAVAGLAEEVLGMIFKEENILFPTALEKLSADEWVEILKESDEIGYTFIRKPAATDELVQKLQQTLCEEAVFKDGAIELPTGSLRLEEVLPLLNTLPIDITFVDSDDTVRYFSQGRHRVFSRTKSVIGRKVQNCHPPQSVDVVEKILRSFRDGAKDNYDFWLDLGGRFVYIRYFALRDGNGRYLGTMEVTQDITGIHALTGEKRLLDERD